MRTITSLIERGLIVKRPRTATGKSYSLHPTEDMLLQWQELARRSDSLVATVFGTRSTTSPNLSDYFFGASYASSSVLPPPCILATKLPIKNALRVLVHADPTFMAMHVLKNSSRQCSALAFAAARFPSIGCMKKFSTMPEQVRLATISSPVTCRGLEKWQLRGIYCLLMSS